MNIVKITASGKVGCGKSAVLGEIEIALKAIGLKVEWDEGAAEKGLTHADWIPELEMYQPTVVLSEKIDIATPAAQGDAKDAERLEFIESGTFDLRCYNDHDDHVYWNVIEHHMAAPIEREIGWGNTARQAIDAAIAAKAAS